MAQRAARGQNRTSPICNWTRLNSPPTRSDSGVFSLEVRDTALVNGVTKLTSPAATSDHQRASLEWDENSWPPYCSVRAVKDAFRQDIKSGSVQRNLAPMFDQRPNRQQNHTFLGWEKAATAHATAASGTGYSILHEDRGRSSQALAKPLRSSCVGLSDVSLFGECSLRARSGQSSKEKGGSVGRSGQCLASYEGTQSRNGLADDQRVHLPCALIGVDCFGIGHEASDVVLEQDAVAAEQLARIANGFAAFDRAERLRERRMLITHHAFVLKLRDTQHHRLGRGDVADHPQNLGGILEGVGVLQAVRLGDTAVLQRDKPVLHDAKRHLGFDLFHREA